MNEATYYYNINHTFIIFYRNPLLQATASHIIIITYKHISIDYGFVMNFY